MKFLWIINKHESNYEGNKKLWRWNELLLLLLLILLFEETINHFVNDLILLLRNSVLVHMVINKKSIIRILDEIYEENLYF